MTPLIAYEAVGFALGLIFGSFLNVCIARLPQDKSVVHPRSQCPDCGAGIRWYDNIPVISWLLLRGRCRDCKRAIALHYPLVEIGLGLWFMGQAAGIYALVYLTPANHLSSLAVIAGIFAHIGIAIFGFLLIGLMVMDWQTRLLPDIFTLGGTTISFLFTAIAAAFLGPDDDAVILGAHHIHLSSAGAVANQGSVFLTGPERMMGDWLLAVSGAVVILLLIRWMYQRLRQREGMGLGDVKLLALIAGFLGFWPAMLALLLGTLTASVYGIVLLARGKAEATSKLAFGSFLAIGGLAAALYGEKLINLYKTLL
ncbi:MAG: prepilin peptidase [Edaphobacter sp.]